MGKGSWPRELAGREQDQRESKSSRVSRNKTMQRLIYRRPAEKKTRTSLTRAAEWPDFLHNIEIEFRFDPFLFSSPRVFPRFFISRPLPLAARADQRQFRLRRYYLSRADGKVVWPRDRFSISYGIWHLSGYSRLEKGSIWFSE